MLVETCPYCRETMEGRDAIRCPSCGTPHHKDCFAENGGCTVFGCESAPGDEPKIALRLSDVTTAPPPPLPSETQSDRTLYIVHRDEQQFGPYSLRELQQFAAEKRIAGTDLTWAQGMPQWVFVSDVIGNLKQESPYPAMFVSAVAGSAGALGMPAQVVQAHDPLTGRFRFGRSLYLLSFTALLFVMGGLSASKDTKGLGAFIFGVGWIAVSVLRIRDVGMSVWAVLLAFVPIANLFLYFMLFCAPRGYQFTKKADTPMKVIGWSLVGLIALGILLWILSFINKSLSATS